MLSSAYTGDGHVGERAAAFVDGELDLATREHVMGHLARCDDCRAEVNDQRRLKARLAALDMPAVSADLLAALARHVAPPEAVAAPGHPGWHEELRPPTVRVGPRPGARPTASRSASERRGRSRRTRRARGIAVGTLATVAATLVTAFAVGGSPPGQAITPDVNQYVVDHTEVSQVLPFSGMPYPGLPAGASVAYQPVGTRSNQ